MLRHEKPIIMRFGDCDPAGILFYPRAVERAHEAVEDMIRASSIGWARWFAGDGFVAPLRRAEADFFSPLRAGEAVTLRASVAALGQTSVTFDVEFAASDGRTAARIRTVHVLVDKITGRPIPIPDDLREAFSSCSGGL